MKAPQPGKVKTRLAAEIGDIGAVRAYRQMVDWQLDRLEDRFSIAVHYTPDNPDGLDLMKAWLGERFPLVPQGEGDLGDRLAEGTAHAFSEGAGAVVCLGGDCPYIDSTLLHAVSRGLERVDGVIGPALDGGYVLLASKAFHPELFRDIYWGTEQVYEQTLARARQAGLRLKALDPLEDVDDLAAWERARDHFCRADRPGTH